MNVFTTDHPMTSQPSWFDAKAHPVLSWFYDVLLLALLLSPLMLFGLYEYAMTDIGADNPFPEPGWALMMGSVLAFVLSLLCACPILLAYRLVARIRQRGHTVALFIIASFCVVLAGCSTTKRGNILDVHDLPSPDGRYVCTVFGEIFYDTTGYPRHVELHRAGEKRSYPGNVCIVSVGSSVEVAWTSPTNLAVRLQFETRGIIPARTNIMGVTVTFSELPRIRYNNSQKSPPPIIVPATSAE
jgi:hypothetical protein